MCGPIHVRSLPRGCRLRKSFWAAIVIAFGSATSARAETRTQAAPDPTNVTFSRQIAPIIRTHCAPCHRPGQPGPFNLLTYADVQRRARVIAAVTATRYMPPWKPESGHGDFVGERRLSQAQVRLIQDWVAMGAPEGDPRDLPSAPVWPEGWQLGQPDLVIQMPEAYTLKASGPDVLRNFVIPIPVTRRRFVKGIEFRPGNPRVVHHATMRIDRTQTSRRRDEEDPESGYEGPTPPDARYPDGHFLAWTPGQLRPLADDGLAWRLEPGSDLVVQLHLVRSGRPESVQVTTGIFFTDVAPTRVPSMIRLSREDLDIPPGQRDYVTEDRYVLPVDVELRELQPHAHLLARRFEGLAEFPDRTVRSLIRIADWDFKWQDVYRLKEPLRLPAGTSLVMRITYDNSSDNVRNPFSPPRRVRFGESTSDEMADLWLQVLPQSREDLAVLERDFGRKSITEDMIGYRHMLEDDPNNPGLHEGLASTYLQLGRGADAVNELEVSLRLNPRSAIGHYNLGTALLVQGRLDEAIVRFEQALRLKPTLAYAQNSLGYALQAKGKIEQAVIHYRQALAIDPGYAHAHNNLGTAFQALGRFGEAASQYEQAARSRPDDPVPERNWAKTLAQQGKAHESTAHFRLALALAPDSPALLADLAWLLAVHAVAEIRAPYESVELAERAAALTGYQDPRVLDVLSAAYAGADEFARAIAVARSAIALAVQRDAIRLAAEIGKRLRLYETNRAYVHDFTTSFGREP